MPDFPVELTDPTRTVPDASLVVRLNKPPEQGSWFDLGDGRAAQVKKVRMIGGERVIFAALESETARARRKDQK